MAYSCCLLKRVYLSGPWNDTNRFMIALTSSNPTIKKTCRFFCLVSATLILTSCPGPRKPEEPKADIENVTITVVDRFDQPIPNLSLEMKRPYSQPMSLQPYEFVDRQSTDASGVAIFPKVKEDDWIKETHDEGYHYYGTVKMEEGKTEYTLRIDDAAIGSIGYSSDVSPEEHDHFADIIDAIKNSMNKVLAYYVNEKHHDFHSLKYYVDQNVMSRAEANRILKMAPRMNDSTKGINFGWGADELRVVDYETPITWVEDTF